MRHVMALAPVLCPSAAGAGHVDEAVATARESAPCTPPFEVLNTRAACPEGGATALDRRRVGP